MHEMHERAFRTRARFRASERLKMHEMHEGYIYPVLSCMRSCTDRKGGAGRGKPQTRLSAWPVSPMGVRHG